MKQFSELNEALNMNQRLRRKRDFLRNKAKVLRGRKIKQKRMATQDTLLVRAGKTARNILTKKLTGGITKAHLNISQRQSVEKILDKRKNAIKKLAKRLLPGVRKKEIERLIKFRSSHNESPNKKS
jgi:hypothetical protein